ncbi:hypothetical protein [Prochlorococcus sp. MIT 1300]|uniref:hypothetical protein n=1 Tax=Prochlorococcus sp. MIT 1300 TaxID=3096218 RepID=UPI002A756F46|nr:hypothetical protein [Prochlorococcus sp. MIT 1300]
MKIIALTDSINPWHSFWIRFGQYTEDLKLPIKITTNPKEILELSDGDILILYRYAIAWGDMSEILQWLRSKKVQIISDIDDCLWQAPGWDKRRLIGLTNTLRNCNIITCSTNSLKELLHTMFHDKRIILIRNSAPKARVRRNNLDEKKLTICWTGAPWTRPNDLAILRPVAEWLARESIEIKWLHIGHSDQMLSFADVIGINSNNIETFPILPHKDYLNTINGDIGFAPISKSMFNEFKSELKLLEFSSLGIPWIASEAISYRELCERWQWEGRLCKNTEDWIKHIQSLLDPYIREREGKALQELSQTKQNRNHTIECWLNILKDNKSNPYY